MMVSGGFGCGDGGDKGGARIASDMIVDMAMSG